MLHTSLSTAEFDQFQLFDMNLNFTPNFNIIVNRIYANENRI